MIILTVHKYLNLRKGTPSINAQVVGYLNPGEQVEIEDVVIGKAIEGNCIWYKLKSDLFCWSGGIKEKEFLLPGKSFSQYNENDQVRFLNSLAKDYYSFWDKHINGFVGVSVGAKNNPVLRGGDHQEYKTQSIIFLLEQKINKANIEGYVIPEVINYKGFTIATDVEQNPKVDAYYIMRSNNFIYDGSPLLLGGSISRNDNYQMVGSRGLKVKRGNDYFVLTCYHVIAHNELVKGINEIKADDPKQKDRFVSIPSPVISGLPESNDAYLYEGKITYYYEFAIARLENQYVLNGNQLYEIGELKGVMTDYSNLTGKKVSLFGTRSHLQSGKVLNRFTHPKINFDESMPSRVMYELIETEKISISGDSGAPVVDENNMLVGILVGGNHCRSYIIPIDRILNNNNLEVCI